LSSRSVLERVEETGEALNRFNGGCSEKKSRLSSSSLRSLEYSTEEGMFVEEVEEDDEEEQTEELLLLIFVTTGGVAVKKTFVGQTGQVLGQS
jgi:hypothetical protein